MTNRLCLLVISLSGLAASAQDFDSANRHLKERSFSRACDGFSAFLKSAPESPLAREATAKRAYACTAVGKGSFLDELRTLADKGEKDFARAWAFGMLVERGERDFEQSIALLKSQTEGRTGAEAHDLLLTLALQDLERNNWNVARVEKQCDLVLANTPSEAQRATARFARARARINNGTKVLDAETELADLGAGSSDLADDALFLLGQRRENEHKFVAALELYDSISKRFSQVTSNVRSGAESRAADIRRPSISINTFYTELPGTPPQISTSWRNVKKAHWKLIRVDPLSIPAGQYPDDADDYVRHGSKETVREWDSTLEVSAPFEFGQKPLDVDPKAPGTFVVTVDAEGQHAANWLLVTRTAVATKTDGRHLLVFVADAETGVATPDAEVAVFTYTNGGHRKFTGKTRGDGVATIELEHTSDSMQVWTRAGTSYAFAQAGNAWSQSWSKEFLAWVMTDRPLYKPGETVGLKTFLRTREGGPSSPLPGQRYQLRIYDPQGKKVVDETQTSNEFGTAPYTLALPKNAPLGLWRLEVYSTDRSYRYDTNSFRVEEYKPPESTVSVEAIGNPKPGEPVRVRIKASFLSGGPISNAQGRALVTIRPWAHQWGPWPLEQPDDSDSPDDSGDDDMPVRYRRQWNPWQYSVFATHTLPFKTGADGTAEVQVPAFELPPQYGAQGLEYAVQALVTDASRREVQGTGSVKLSLTPVFVDVRTSHDIYRPGERIAVTLRAEDANHRPAAQDVLVRLSRLDEKGSAKILEVRTRIVNGQGAALLDADAIGQARLEVFDAALTAPQTAMAQTDLWLTNDTRPMSPPNAGFQLYVDHAPLKAGQNVRALVAATRPGGHVLVTLENDAVEAYKVVELKGRAAFVELAVTAALAPNAWLTAMRFEDARLDLTERPIRVSGGLVELPIKVAFPAASAEPGSKIATTVSTNTTLQTEVALTVVDQALFSIEPERTDFLRFFGRTPRPHAVRTQVSHNQRAYRLKPAPAKQVATDQPPRDSERKDGLADKKAAPSGGAAPASKAAGEEREASSELAAAAPVTSRARADADDASGFKRKDASKSEPEGQAEPVKVRTDFSSSSGWFPALSLVNGRLTQTIALKDSLTAWKAVATVVTPGPELGQGSATIRTAKALMVRLQAPRFFVEGDEVVLSAVIESHLAKPADVEVQLEAPGFKPLGNARGTVHVTPEQVLRFDAKFKVVELGERTLRATVRGGGTSDAMEWKLPAFVHGSAQRQYFTGRMTDQFGFEFELPDKRKAPLTRLELTLAPSLLAVMFDGLPYLAQYPYGCVEQTLSRFVPATIARRAAADLSLPADRVPEHLDDMVQQGLDRLYGFQHDDGGWGWWRDDHTNDWMTAYVVYALSLAKESGVQVPPTVLKRGRDYLTSHLGKNLDTPETHAFMVFALAQSGGAPKAAVDTLFARRTTLTARARGQLALALLTAKDPRARVAVENLDDVVKAAQSRPDASVGEANDPWSTSAAIEATAFTLMAYARYDLNSPLIAPLTDFLVLRRNGGRWRNTRDTAFAIYALSDLAKLEKAAAKSATFVISLNGREVRRVQTSKGGLDWREPLLFKDSDLKAGRNAVTVKRDGAGTGYWAATFDVFNMNDFIRGVGGDVKVKRTYTVLGRPSTDTPAAMGAEYGMPVESGVRVRVDLELTANKAVEFVMIEDLKPAGFEAVEVRSGPQVCNYACAHAELRTDRVAMFLSSLNVGTTKVSYELRAEVPGRFAALPARFEAMYAPELQATADEMRFEVRDAPAGDVASH